MRLNYKLLSLLALTAVVQLEAQSGLIYGELLQPPSWSGRAAGMGNTGLAVADDQDGGWLNPATPALLHRIQGVVSVQSQTASMFSVQNTGNQDLVYQLQPATQNALNGAGFNIPLQYHKRPFVIGMQLRNLADMQTRYRWRSLHTNSDDYTETEIKREGAVYGLAASVATLFSPSFSIGARFSMLGGRQKVDTSYTVLEQDSRAFARTQWQNRFTGYVFEFGYQWRINPRWTLGQTIILPYTQKLTDIEMNTIALQRSYSNVLAMQLPAQIWTGIAWRLQTNLLAAVDYRFRPLAKVKFQGTAPLHFSDAHSLHAGLEYRLPVNHSVIPLRIGWHNQPRQTYEFDRTNPGQDGRQIVTSSFTAGFGMLLGSLQIDAAVDMERYSYPTQWFIIGEEPVNIEQTRYHFVLTFLYLL